MGRSWLRAAAPLTGVGCCTLSRHPSDAEKRTFLLEAVRSALDSGPPWSDIAHYGPSRP